MAATASQHTGPWCHSNQTSLFPERHARNLGDFLTLSEIFSLRLTPTFWRFSWRIRLLIRTRPTVSRPGGGSVLHKTVFLISPILLCSSCTAIHGSLLDVIDFPTVTDRIFAAFIIFNTNSEQDPRAVVLSSQPGK